MAPSQIMIVEDENIIAMDIQETLKGMGFGTAVASNGEDAVITATETRPDLVLMDIVLPGEIDGIEAAQKIREQLDIPVIYLTAYSDVNTLHRAKITEPFGYLLKPLKERELLATVEMALYKHKIEVKLKESEQRFSTTLKSIGDAVIATDENGLITFMNPVAEALTGWRSEESLGKELTRSFRIINERTRAPAQSRITSALRNGIAGNLDSLTLLIARDRKEIPIDYSLAPIKDDRGEVRGVVIAFHDISERRRAEEDAREAEKKYRSIFENSVEGLIQVLPSGRITLANPAAARIFGYESPEEMASTMADIGHHWMEPEFRKEFQEQIETEGIVRGFEFQVLRKDLSKIWVSASARAIRDERGKFLYYEASFEDISGRKQLEQQLLQSQKMEAIGRLAGGIAHDFNNLLTAIIGYSHLVLSTLKKGDPIYAHVEEIEKAGNRAATLTSQLLTFSRKQVFQPRVMDLNLLVTDFHKLLRRLIGESIELRVDLAPELGRVNADPGQIEQVIMNLVVNARDAMPQGGKLVIETSNVELENDYAINQAGVPPGRYVRLAVTDTGFGMDKETQARLFEPFFTTKEKGKGTGLGLSTVYGIVQQSGGNVSVRSKPGRGTTFKVYLPRVDEAPQAITKKRASVELQGSETVLLAEDEETLRKLVARALEANGYTVLEASNGEEAFSICEQYDKPIHLMISDVVMPKMSGQQLASRLLTVRPKMKVLYMSGYTDDTISYEGLPAHFIFLQKPFTPDNLLGKVREVINGAKEQKAGE